VVVTPYHSSRGTAESAPTLVPQATPRRSQPRCSSRRFDKLNAVKKSEYMAFLKRKLGEWYRAAPKRPALPGNRAEGAGRRRRATGAECGRGRSARGWCQHFGFLVCNQLVNVFRPDFACQTAGSTGGRAGSYPRS